MTSKAPRTAERPRFWAECSRSEYVWMFGMFWMFGCSFSDVLRALFRCSCIFAGKIYITFCIKLFAWLQKNIPNPPDLYDLQFFCTSGNSQHPDTAAPKKHPKSTYPIRSFICFHVRKNATSRNHRRTHHFALPPKHQKSTWPIRSFHIFYVRKRPKSTSPIAAIHFVAPKKHQGSTWPIRSFHVFCVRKRPKSTSPIRSSFFFFSSICSLRSQ